MSPSNHNLTAKTVPFEETELLSWNEISEHFYRLLNIAGFQ